MKRAISLSILLALFATTTGSTGPPPQTKEPRPRFMAKQGDQPGWIDLKQYWAMPDPKEAGRLLLKEAQLAGRDLDEQRPSPPIDGFAFRNGVRVRPDPNDDSFERAVAAQVAAGASGDTICVIHWMRLPTLREIAETMALGVEFGSDDVLGRYIARVPLSQVSAVAALDYVVWMGALLPEYKYDPGGFRGGHPISVRPFDQDRSRYREDLEQCSASILGFYYGRYLINLPADSVPTLARLPWVQGIAEVRPGVFDQVGNQLDLATQTGVLNFRPQDSRKLVSALYDTNRKGASVAGPERIGILDNGCDYDHFELRARVLEDLSDVSIDSLHGTHVAGILVGSRKVFDASTFCEGVASQATLVALSSYLHPPHFISEYVNDGVFTWNMSWHQPEEGYGYGNSAKVLDFAADADDMLIVASLGNTGHWPPPSPATAKNVLSVGAIHYVTNDNDTLGKLTEYTAVGPTHFDYRMKPELVAPGGGPEAGTGGVSMSPDLRSGVVSCMNFSAASYYWRWVSGQYVRAAGTSMAAPHVTGAAAVVGGWFKSVRDDLYFGQPRSSELMRALLVNAAIPLRWNGDAPGFEDQADTLRGFWNEEYGYGLVNAWSGVSSPPNEYARVKIWQSSVPTDGIAVSDTLVVGRNPEGVAPRFLVATMAYDDRPGTIDGQPTSAAMLDGLLFEMQAPSGAYYSFAPPLGVVQGTVQKIMVPRPELGTWTAHVRCVYSVGGSPTPQDFAVVADVMYTTPAIGVSLGLTNDEIVVTKGQKFEVPVIVTNVGGNVLAGVTARITGESEETALFDPIESELGTTYYLDNLVKSGSVSTRRFALGAPLFAGTYQLRVEVDAINKLLPSGTYPITRDFVVRVRQQQMIKGQVKMLASWGAPVKGVKLQAGGQTLGQTDASGQYELSVPEEWSGTVAPEKAGAVFLPESRSYANLMADSEDQDYDTEFFKISGWITEGPGQIAAGVSVAPIETGTEDLLDHGGVSDGATGHYEVWVEQGWKGNIAPQVSGSYVSFTPAIVEVDSIVGDVSLNFTAQRADVWQENGVEVIPTARLGAIPDAASDGMGGAVVISTDVRNMATSGVDIWAQHVDHAGTLLWGAGRPVVEATGEQRRPAIEPLLDGTYVVVWKDLRNDAGDIYASRLGSDGTALWGPDGIPVCAALGEQTDQVVSPLADGSVVCVWKDARSGAYDLYGQRITPDGTLLWGQNGLLVCDEPGDPQSLNLDADGDHSFVVWADVLNEGVLAQYLDGSGAGWSSAPDGLRVDQGLPGYPAHSPVAVVIDSALCAIFYSHTRAPTPDYFYPAPLVVQGIHGDGTKVYDDPTYGAKSIKNYDDVAVPTRAAADGFGGAFLAGVHNRTFIFHYAPSSGSWAEPVYVGNGNHSNPTVCLDGDTGVMVAWEAGSSSKDIYAQRLDGLGARYWGGGIDLSVASGDQTLPVVVADDVGGALVFWADDRDPEHTSIFASRVNDTRRTFLISGQVVDEMGSPLEGIQLETADGVEVMTRDVTGNDGSYILSVPEFWSGEVVPRLVGHLNQSSPTTLGVDHIMVDKTADFVLSHLQTTWERDGLALSLGGAGDVVVAPDGFGGAFTVWEQEEDYENRLMIQRVAADGDAQWAINGRPVTAPAGDDTQPCIVPTLDGGAIVVWRRTVPGYLEYVKSVCAQRLGGDASLAWQGGERYLYSGSDIQYVAACPSWDGGAFICWYDGEIQKLLMNRLTPQGDFAWSEHVVLWMAYLAERPALRPVGSSALVSWIGQDLPEGQLKSLAVQMVSDAGITLWGGPGSWLPVIVRGWAYPAAGTFCAIPAQTGGAYLAWSEVPPAPDPLVPRAYAQYLDDSGNATIPTPGFRIVTSDDWEYLEDLAIDGEEGFFACLKRTNGTYVTGLTIQNLVPAGSTMERRWGDSGREVSEGWVHGARILEDGTPGLSVVVWTEDVSDRREVYASWRGRGGFPRWQLSPKAIIREGTGLIQAWDAIPDGSGGAIAAWSDLRAWPPRVFAGRANETVLAGAEVSTECLVRRFTGQVDELDSTFALGCPAGDADDIIVRLELRGNVVNPVPATAFAVEPDSSQGFVVWRESHADSATTLYGDHYRTTITVSELSGCGEGDLLVKAYGNAIANAHVSVRSPDIEPFGVFPGVDVEDFGWYGLHHPSSVCNCIYENPYWHCADFSPPMPPDTMVSIEDFGIFGLHIYHEYSGGASAVAGGSGAFSSGTISLAVTNGTNANGDPRVFLDVAAIGIEPYRAIAILIAEHNPSLRLAAWHQDPAYASKTMCVEVTRNGTPTIVIGALGSKDRPPGPVGLGHVELAADPEENPELKEGDFEVLVAELQEIGGSILAIPGAEIQGTRPKRYVFELRQNYPNPFNPQTTIVYSVPYPGPVSLRLFDVTGALVKTLVLRPQTPGQYRVVWDGTNNSGNRVASGVYFYRLEAGPHVSARKMVVLK